jgi:hypothetical protein
MRPVAVRIMHPEPGPAAGPLERWVADARSVVAERHAAGFAAAGASDVAVVRGPADDRPFGARLRALVRVDRPAGLVILGSGAIPLATARDRRDLVVAAGDERCIALANNRYSADVVAIARAETLTDLPDLPGDNALPRWLSEARGYEVTDLRRRWRLGFDIDGPLDVVLLGGRGRRAGDGLPAAALGSPPDLGPTATRIARIREVAADRRAELLVAGRTSAATIGWLERNVPARVRALVEERGMRAASRLAQAEADEQAEADDPSRPSRLTARPPVSVLGALLERDGPSSLGLHLARLAEAAIIDSRVLLAHRLGADETAWPVAEDRFASDLLLWEDIRDPWLRALTASAAAAPIPVLLGGHTLVGPGVRLLLASGSRRSSWT